MQLTKSMDLFLDASELKLDHIYLLFPQLLSLERNLITSCIKNLSIYKNYKKVDKSSTAGTAKDFQLAELRIRYSKSL